jgi:hypothetical protein
MQRRRENLFRPSQSFENSLPQLPALTSEFPSRPYLHCLHPPVLQNGQACHWNKQSRSLLMSQNQTSSEDFQGFRLESSASEAIDSLCSLSVPIPGNIEVIDEPWKLGYPLLTEAALHPSHRDESQFISSTFQEGMLAANLTTSGEQEKIEGIQSRYSLLQTLKNAIRSDPNEYPRNQSSPPMFSIPQSPEKESSLFETKRILANSSEGSPESKSGSHPGKDLFQARRCPFLGCAKILCRKSYIKAHMRFHTRERPFCCVVTSCTMRFRWKSNLIRHLRTGHDLASSF